MEAWRIPPVWEKLQGNNYDVPENSRVPQKQRELLKSTMSVLESIVADMRGGLLETVGVESSFLIDDGRCSIILDLPETADTELIARAIDAENVEAWRNSQGKVCVAVNPWYSTKDVDQAVLCAIKVVHVLLGIHATDENRPKTFKQKILKSLQEILEIQKASKK